MSKVYNIALSVAKTAIKTVAAIAPDESSAKFLRFGRGQLSTRRDVEALGEKIDHCKPVFWIHAASLGEFAIARPIIRKLKSTLDCIVVVTFFSPTGYEALRRHPMREIDGVLYLPIDTEKNARHFVETLRPDCALFMVSEFWHNYLLELGRKKIPTFLVSALIRDDAPFFNKWYGNIYRKSLETFSHIFTLDRHSLENLNKLGVKSASINGDPLFDNAVQIASSRWEDPILNLFCNNRKVFVAGSIHEDEDLDMICDLANRNPDTKFIIVPHEITPGVISTLLSRLKGSTVVYGNAAGEEIDKAQNLIVDFVGALASIYRYGTFAYVGGGFTPLLHSVIEPVVYGLPVAFGPKIHRKVAARQLIEEGIGRSVSDAVELEKWFSELRLNPSALSDIKERADRYVKQNIGATPRVADAVIKSIKDAR